MKGWSRSRRSVIGLLPVNLCLPWLILLYACGISSAHLASSHHKENKVMDIERTLTIGRLISRISRPLIRE